MESCVRLFNSSVALNRCFFTRTTATTAISTHYLKFPLNNNVVSHYTRIHSSISPTTPNPFKIFLSLSHSKLFNTSPFAASHSTPFRTDPNDAGFTWNPAAPRGAIDGGANVAGFGDQGKAVTVVLLGWMGAKTKHLKRYVEWYNSKGINAITFVVDVREVFWLDLGRRTDKRISDLRDAIATWVSEKEEDGRERCLLFHTFSNTGWFVCGTILDGFQGRQDLMDKIKGFVVDSGGVELLNPKVWAAGFSAAILKKHSSFARTPAVQPINGFEGGEVSVSKAKEKEPRMVETMVVSVLEKIFTSIVNSPEMNQRLRKILSFRTSEQLSCPWLHLYSRGDTVVPYKSIEALVEEQRKLGKKAFNYDFRLSPHVDHFRNFREKYTSELHKFFEECFATVKKQQGITT